MSDIVSQEKKIEVHQASEFIIKLEKVGLTSGLAQQIIQSPGNKLAEKMMAGLEESIEEKNKIPEFPRKITVQLPKGEFIARDYFTEDKFDMGSNFREWFLGVVETHNGEEVEIKIHKLTKASVDNDIITDLGGEGVVETSFASLIGLMPHLAKNQWYLFYIRDVNGELRAVRLDRDDDGCFVNAYSVEDPVEWHAGRQVVSGNFRDLDI